MPRASRTRRLSLWLPPLCLMAVIFAFSAQSNPVPVVTAHVWDKLLHAVEYGTLAALVARALLGEGLTMAPAILGAALIASAYGATDEYHQSFVPERSSDVTDWMADTVGAL